MLVLINIDSKGYGKIYKSVMRDKGLPLLARNLCLFLRLCRLRLPGRGAGVGDIQRDTLHGFSCPKEKQRCQQTMDGILREIVSQTVVRLHQAQCRERFLEKLESSAPLEMVYRLLIHWEEIQSIQGYVAVALDNL